MKIFSLLIILFSFSAWAQKVVIKPLEAKKNERASLLIGSKVEMSGEGKKTITSAQFLGRMVMQDGRSEEFLILDESQKRVLLVDYKNIQMKSGKTKSQAILSPIDQVGGTCAAYAFMHFWQQMYWSGFKGTKDFDFMMRDERERLKLFEESLGRYYLDRRVTANSLMTSYGKRFGFKCKSYKFSDAKKAADYIFEKTSEGKPVVIEFDIGGEDMVESDYVLQDYESRKKLDPRLWIPQAKGQKLSSGHSIVGAAGFVSKGKRKILVLDSNWTEPRVWDLDSYVGNKTIMETMGFYSCN
jgi:hypothetical protein